MPNSKIWDVILLTEQRYVNPSSEEEYVLNLLEDDRIFKEALEKHGLRVKRVGPMESAVTNGANVFTEQDQYASRIGF